MSFTIRACHAYVGLTGLVFQYLALVELVIHQATTCPLFSSTILPNQRHTHQPLLKLFLLRTKCTRPAIKLRFSPSASYVYNDVFELNKNSAEYNVSFSKVHMQVNVIVLQQLIPHKSQVTVTLRLRSHISIILGYRVLWT